MPHLRFIHQRVQNHQGAKEEENVQPGSWSRLLHLRRLSVLPHQRHSLYFGDCDNRPRKKKLGLLQKRSRYLQKSQKHRPRQPQNDRHSLQRLGGLHLYL